MAILTKKFSLVLYVGASPLTLSSLPTGVKAAIRRITQPNAGGTGYASFNPASGVNSLTTAVAATATVVQQFIVETIASTGISIDLGTNWAFAPADGGRLVFTVPVGQAGFVAPAVTIAAADAGSYVIESSTGLTALSYVKNGTAVTTLSTTVPVALASTDTFGFTSTTQAGVLGVLTLIKQ